MSNPKPAIILNVDDYPPGRYATTQALKQAGFEVWEADCGAEALRQAGRGPDLVLLDVNLPDFSGIEVCRRLKNDPATRHLPVLHLSATYVKSGDRVAGLEGGADGYLVQPVEPEELTAAIHALLRLKESEKNLRESEAWFRTTLYSIGDALIATDVQGRVRLLNPAAEALTGWQNEEACGKLLDEVFRIVDEQTGQPVENPVTRALSQEEAVRLSNNTVLISRNGQERPIADSAAPIKDQAGAVIGGVLVFRDQTQERRAKKELLTLAREWQTTFDATNSAIFLLDRDFRVRRANCTSEKFFARPASEMEGRPCWEIVHGTSQPLPECPILKMRKSRQREGMELQVGQRWFEVTVDPVFDDTGGLAGVVHIVTDITDRKYQEQVQREHEARHCLILKSSVDGFGVTDLQGRLLEVNEAFCRMTGYDEPELLTLTIPDLDTSKAPAEVALHLNKIVKEGEDRFETCLRRKDGSTVAVEICAKFLPREGGRTFAFLRDLTERKQQEEARGESEARHRMILKTTMDGFWMADMQGRLLEVNEAYCGMTGYSEPELLAMSIADLEVSETPTDIAAHVQKIQAEGEDRFETRHRRKDGSIIDVEVSVQYKPTQGGLLTAFIRDLTPRKEAEKEKQKLQEQLQQAMKMESIGRLAGGVAHDFNNKLQVVLGYTDFMLNDPGPMNTDQVKMLLEIRKAAQQSADLTRQLLGFARKQVVIPKVLDLNENIEGMLNILRRLIGEDIDLVWMPETRLWPVRIDPSQVDQILANLVVNARDAIAGVGKVTIETGKATFDKHYCATHAEAVPGQYVMLAVSDNGCGMEKEVLAHLFEPFFTTKEVGQGTGLGLATVYGIAKQNEGFINVYSEPGKGTTFKIFLPRYLGEVPSTFVEPEETTHKGRGETVLLVEDDEMVLNYGKVLLEHIGYKVISAAHPEEALRLAREHDGEIHLLITDVIMPTMNGRDLADQILTLRPGLKYVFTSGYTANVIAHHGVLDAGVNFIPKPFRLADLAAKVREALGK